jgi:iron complex outermembrane receptor protein
LADGIPVYAGGSVEIYKSLSRHRFRFGMINFIPKYMTEKGFQTGINFEGVSSGAFAHGRQLEN